MISYLLFFFFAFVLFCFVLFVCLFVPISSSICKLPIRSEIYNCTLKNILSEAWRCTGSGRKRINDCVSTMSDKILDGIFPHSSQNLSFELFWRLLALGYYFVLKVCGHTIEVAIELAAAAFVNYYNSMPKHLAMSFLTKLNFWRSKSYIIWLDSFLYHLHSQHG